MKGVHLFHVVDLHLVLGLDSVSIMDFKANDRTGHKRLYLISHIRNVVKNCFIFNHEVLLNWNL